ncbi:MAG: threonine--tRNA ligase [Chlamydiae bacterium GWF2_49_8]|nr:MAG: threonine--tRNA ligase [Chlamydiae bacterium GWF2_49_8]
MFIKVKDRGKLEFKDGSSAKEIADALNLTSPHEAVAVSINGVFRDFSTPLAEGDEVIFYNFENKEGKEVFWHSSAHVLAQAVLRLWPKATPTIGPPIENGFYYDFANLEISDKDFELLEQEIQKILKENYLSLRFHFKDKEEAIERFDHNPYKTELIEGFEEGPITAYSQGEFFDLCRGPHLYNLGKIKAFKVLKTAGAYWRGDSKREMLTRIYAISYPDRKQLQDYLALLEEAKKRDHKLLGPRLDLFSLQEEAPGMPFIHPKGMIIWNALLAFWRELHQEAGYIEIKTPQLMSQELWERSGHWMYYRENMYAFSIEERNFAIKPMSCPGCMLYFKTKSHSYREFPLRIAEFGHVHRHEPSGALSGLFRVRSFHQDDAHLFMRPSDIREEILDLFALVEKIYSAFGLSYSLELSTRPEKSIGSAQEWKIATEGLKGALDEWDEPYQINEGEGAFYGPKIDLHVRDALGRRWQCGTIQLDMSLPEKFELEYTDCDGERKRPVMIHRAIFGSIERFFGILIEHFAGRFPLWLSPHQVRILTVADRHIERARHVEREIKKSGLICDVDDSNESVSKKVRNAQLLQINYILTIGDKELENKTVNLRTRDNVVHGEVALPHFLENLREEKNQRVLPKQAPRCAARQSQIDSREE